MWGWYLDNIKKHVDNWTLTNNIIFLQNTANAENGSFISSRKFYRTLREKMKCYELQTAGYVLIVRLNQLPVFEMDSEALYL